MHRVLKRGLNSQKEAIVALTRHALKFESAWFILHVVSVPKMHDARNVGAC